MSSGKRMGYIYWKYKQGLKQANRNVYPIIRRAVKWSSPQAIKVAKAKLRKNSGLSRKLSRKMIRESLRSMRMKEIKGLCKTGSPTHWGRGRRG